MGNCKRGRIFRDFREYSFSWFRCNQYSSKNNRNRNKYQHYFYFWSIILLINSPLKILANTTIASPSASSSGSVVNNGYLIQPGGYPVNRYSQGIQCAQTSLAITPFITRGENWAWPRFDVTHQNVYNDQENEDGSLKFPGKVDYVNEQNRYQQNTNTINFGITASIQIPLDRRFQSACLKAVQTNIEAQKLLIQSSRLTMELNRLKVCAAQAREGAKFINEYAVNCEGIEVRVPGDKLVPHKHAIK